MPGNAMAALDQNLDHFDHLGNVTGGPRLVCSAAGSRVRRTRRAAPAQSGRRANQGTPASADLIKILSSMSVMLAITVTPVAGPRQPASEYVEDHFLADMSQVGTRLHRESAVVDRYPPRHDRFEGAYRLRGGVVEPERVGPSARFGVLCHEC